MVKVIRGKFWPNEYQDRGNGCPEGRRCRGRPGDRRTHRECRFAALENWSVTVNNPSKPPESLGPVYRGQRLPRVEIDVICTELHVPVDK